MLKRRSFLALSAPAGISLFARISDNNRFQTGINVQDLRASLLAMVNEERSLEKVPELAFDELATQVATAHALDMAKRKFASHWGSDGRKPYQRYSFAGGTHATEENVSSANNTWSLKPKDIAQDVAYLHVRLYSEVPPRDAHRRTILAPQHTHVGFGIAIDELRLRVVELFVGKHVEVDPLQRKAKIGETLEFAGKLLNPNHSLAQIEIFYEPQPALPDLTWLQTARPYSLPNESVTLRPRLLSPLLYSDGSRGIIEINGRNFRTPVTLFEKTPGIYTIACWIRPSRTEKPFIATEVCIEAG
jgi:uncharacterized protein YkwD